MGSRLGLIDKAGELVGLPHAYRDPRNAAAYDEVLAKLGADRIYRTTGIQFMPLNSLYSLYVHYSHHMGYPVALANIQAAAVHARLVSLLVERTLHD